jgi:hypothetical protein
MRIGIEVSVSPAGIDRGRLDRQRIGGPCAAHLCLGNVLCDASGTDSSSANLPGAQLGSSGRYIVRARPAAPSAASGAGPLGTQPGLKGFGDWRRERWHFCDIAG